MDPLRELDESARRTGAFRSGGPEDAGKEAKPRRRMPPRVQPRLSPVMLPAGTLLKFSHFLNL